MKILSVILLLVSTSTTVWSQSFAVFVETSCSNVDMNSVDLSGMEHAITASAVETPQVSFYFKNMSGTTKTVTVSRTIICVPSEWSNELIWEPACTDPSFEGLHYSEGQIDNNWESMSITIPNDSLGRLVSTIDFNGGTTDGIYRYYFRANGILTDSVDLKINGGCTLGLDDSDQKIGLSLFPNPANKELTISTFGLNGNHTIRMTDLSGKIVSEVGINEFSTIQTGEFENGVYFISLMENELVLQTQRIVIRH